MSTCLSQDQWNSKPYGRESSSSVVNAVLFTKLYYPTNLDVSQQITKENIICMHTCIHTMEFSLLTTKRLFAESWIITGRKLILFQKDILLFIIPRFYIDI